MPNEQKQSTVLTALGGRVLKTFIARAISASGTLAVSFAVIRVFGLDELGRYSLWSAILLGIALLARFGTTAQIMKFCGSDMPEPEVGHRVYHDAIRFGLVTSVPLVAATLLIGTVFDLFSLRDSILLLGAPLLATNYSIGALQRARAKAHLAPLLEFGSASLGVAGMLLVLDTLWDTMPVAVLAPLTLGWLLFQLFVGQRWIAVSAPDVNLRDREQGRNSLMETARSSADFFTVELGQYFSQWGLLIVIAALLSSEDVATFATLQRLTFLTNFILGVVSNTISTNVSELYSAGRTAELKSLRRKSRILLMSYGAVVGGALLLARTPVLSALGIEDMNAPRVLVILVIFQLINVSTGLAPVFLRMSGGERELRNVVLAAFALQFVLVAWLTGSFGITGTALGFGVAPIAKNLSCLVLEGRAESRRSERILQR